MSHLKIAIVGAGLMGRLVAWSRAKAGDEVTLIDNDNGDGKFSAGLTAAAMIAAGTECAVKDYRVFEIGRNGVSQWRAILEQLQIESGQSVYFNCDGTLVLSHPDDQSLWDGFHQNSKVRPGQPFYTKISSQQIRELEPELADRFSRALFFPDEGVLCNHELFQALQTVLSQRDIRWITGRHVNRVNDISDTGEFDFVVDTRGLGARPDQPDLRGVRGEVIRVYAPDVKINRPIRLLHPRYPLYVAPHGNFQYVIGATEIESDAMHSVTVRSGLELLSALYSVHPGFGEAEILSMDVNCRPAYADNLPRIRVAGSQISINGLYRHGFLFAPELLSSVEHLIDRRQFETATPWYVEFRDTENKIEAFA